MANKKRVQRRKKKKGKSPIRFLFILLTELVVLLGILLYLYIYHPDNPISTALHKMIDPIPEVVLDAGHGGYDSGSEFNGVLEKDVTLALTKDIGAALEAKGIPVCYTRESDDVAWPADNIKDLDARVQIANTSGAKLFVSIHTNANETKTGSGFEIWGDYNDKTILNFAKHIQTSVNTLGYTMDRGLKDVAISPLQVLYKNKLPSVLLEAGFLESERDRAYLLQDGRRKAFANKIAEGIYKTLQDEKKKHS